MQFRSGFSFVAAALLPALLSAQSAYQTRGRVIMPESNFSASSEAGTRAHTDLRILIPNVTGVTQAAGSPPVAGLFYETPASIACIYGLVSHPKAGCNPNVVTANPSGGSGAIAIVDAYDNPTAAEDLAAFSTQFGLPPAKFQVVYAAGTNPGVDPTGSWEVEEALDVQWAHAMAPNAKIYLVEAATNQISDLLVAIDTASQLVAAAGGGEVSMSWGSDEASDELTLDNHFIVPGVLFFSGTGDSPGTIWPSVSPNVIAAGGTSITRDPVTGNFLLETAWQDGGGGSSPYVPRPSFQDGIRHLVGAYRATPDLSFDANPYSGVWILSTSNAGGVPAGWLVVGGTSVSSPALAGITNASGNARTSSQAQNSFNYRNSQLFRDIVYGNCGNYLASFSNYGWDFCTGLGTPHGSWR